MILSHELGTTLDKKGLSYIFYAFSRNNEIFKTDLFEKWLRISNFYSKIAKLF